MVPCQRAEEVRVGMSRTYPTDVPDGTSATTSGRRPWGQRRVTGSCDDAAVDTVEWGSDLPTSRWDRLALPAPVSRRAALALAGLGVVLLMAAEALPWMTVHLDRTAT